MGGARKPDVPMVGSGFDTQFPESLLPCGAGLCFGAAQELTALAAQFQDVARTLNAQFLDKQEIIRLMMISVSTRHAPSCISGIRRKG